MGTNPQMVKVPADVLALLQTLLRAALLDRPTKEQADAAYLARDTTYIKSITPTQGGIAILTSDDEITEVSIDSVPTELATPINDGLMSAADKAKLDELDPNVNPTPYTLPTATGTTLGGVKIGQNVNISGGKISVFGATDTQAGVTKLYNNTDGEHADGAITQAAAVSALTALVNQLSALTSRVEGAESKITAVYRYKGSVQTYDDLPTAFLAVGDTYNVKEGNEERGIAAGDNVAWSGSEWDVLSGFVDLSGLLAKSGGVIDGDLTINGTVNGIEIADIITKENLGKELKELLPANVWTKDEMWIS